MQEDSAKLFSDLSGRVCGLAEDAPAVSDETSGARRLGSVFEIGFSDIFTVGPFPQELSLVF